MIKRERLGNYPYELKKDGEKIILRFFPKDPAAKFPDNVVFVLPLDREDKMKLTKLIS